MLVISNRITAVQLVHQKEDFFKNKNLPKKKIFISIASSDRRKVWPTFSFVLKQ